MAGDVATSEDLPFQTPGEWAAHLRWREVVAEDHSLGGWAQEVIGKPIDRVEERLFRTNGVTLADRAVVAGIEQLAKVSRRALVSEVPRAYRRTGQQVEALEDIRTLPLDDIDRAVAPLSRKYLTGAGVGGALGGALGATGVIGGIPPLMFVSLHAIHRLALLHGHDIGRSAEQRFSVLVLATSLVSRPKIHAKVASRLQTVAQEMESDGPEHSVRHNSDKITENVAEALALQVVLGFMTRGWPLAGSLLGASYTRAFVSRAFETGRAAYGQRALLRRYGDAARVTSQ